MKLWHYAFIVFLGGCCYGILSTFVKLAYSAGFTVAEVTGAQYFFGTVLSWIVVLFTKRKKLTYKQTSKLILSGIPSGLTGLFYCQSLQNLNASLAIVLLFQFVWIGALYEWVFQKRRPTKKKLISIGILLIGSMLAANVMFQENVTLSWQGAIWGFLAALSFAMFIFLSGSVEKGTPPILKSALLSTGAVITVFVVFPPTFLFNFDVLTGLSPYGLLLGVFGVVLPPLLYSIGMPQVGSGMGTILTASELPMAILMSSLVLGEHVGLPQWIGVLIILGGIVGSNIRRGDSEQQSLNIQKSTTF
ncbi:DMT family transporter [Paenibacillus kribbensis]|uniref:EamA family transporter n=1 Tax=Paenibacillus TaxID=44249 RepID=UPI00024F06E8|nr:MULTISPECIES: DMT family transporter [Paenibacillus]EHS55527.1 drug/metabolite transporter (DMT) superfamily protein [Paenibacillus sp. Aloe-11]MEC0236092.1 DMT family transporter [Paenibacillus kribbensis]